MPRRRPRRTSTRAALAVLTLSVLVAGSVGVLVDRLTRSGPVVVIPACQVSADGQSVSMSVDQAANAATIAAVGLARGLPVRAVQVALATAIQESTLRNLDFGDRDSLGLFQQRPSQGWGTPAQIMDPVYAASRFYAALVRVPDYLRIPITEAAQSVQHSAHPQAYADHQVQALALARALTGAAPASLSCQLPPTSPPTVATDPGGFTPAAAAVRQSMTRQFGTRLLPTVVAAPGRSGGALVARLGPGRAGSTASPTSGRAPTGGTATGWAVAVWTVAHAQRLGIAEVSYANRTWQLLSSQRGWQPATAGPQGTAAPPGTVLIILG
ncbi:MAG: heavy metal transporter [Actinomycetes bacterium]